MTDPTDRAPGWPDLGESADHIEQLQLELQNAAQRTTIEAQTRAYNKVVASLRAEIDRANDNARKLNRVAEERDAALAMIARALDVPLRTTWDLASPALAEVGDILRSASLDALAARDAETAARALRSAAGFTTEPDFVFRDLAEVRGWLLQRADDSERSAQSATPSTPPSDE